MKHLKPYEILESLEDLPKDIDGKYIYPYEKIYPIFKWFRDEYYEFMNNDGWLLYSTGLPRFIKNWDKNRVLIVGVSLKKGSTNDYARKQSEKYGFLLDDNGVIYDFDKEKFNKNKHLITGYELGLL